MASKRTANRSWSCCSARELWRSVTLSLIHISREDNKREKDRIHVAILKMNGVMDVVGRILAEYSDQFPQTEFQLKEYSDMKDLAGINAPDLIITLSNGFDYTKIKDKFNWAELHSFCLLYTSRCV